MYGKTLTGALLVSAALHTAALTGFSFDWSARRAPDDGVILVSYYPDQTAPPRVKKQVPARRTPRAQRPKVATAVRQAQPEPSVSPAVEAEVAADTLRFLSDPQKGKIFRSYFALIKDKINSEVRQRYSGQSGVSGTVTLLFVVDADGALKKVSIAERSSRGASEAAKELARQCVTAAGPFPVIPLELESKKLSFSLAIIFEADSGE